MHGVSRVWRKSGTRRCKDLSCHATIIPFRTDPLSSELGSQPELGCISTGERDHLGTRSVVVFCKFARFCTALQGQQLPSESEAWHSTTHPHHICVQKELIGWQRRICEHLAVSGAVSADPGSATYCTQLPESRCTAKPQAELGCPSELRILKAAAKPRLV